MSKLVKRSNWYKEKAPDRTINSVNMGDFGDFQLVVDMTTDDKRCYCLVHERTGIYRQTKLMEQTFERTFLSGDDIRKLEQEAKEYGFAADVYLQAFEEVCTTAATIMFQLRQFHSQAQSALGLLDDEILIEREERIQ